MADIFESSANVGRLLATVTSFVETGATSLVAAPATGYAIAVHHIHAMPITTTAGFNDLHWKQDGQATTTSLRMWTGAWALSAGSAIINQTFDPPWVLNDAVALVAVLSLTTSSTPTVYINARYRIIKVS